MKFSIKPVLALIILALLAALWQPNTASAQDAPSQSKLRFIHALPGAPAVDVYVDSVLAARALAYGNGTRYLAVQPGQRAVLITATGSTAPLFQANVDAQRGLAQSVVVQGTAASIEVGLYQDELFPLRLGNIRMTAIHAIKDAPPVDVLQVDGQNVIPLVQGLAYGQPYGTFDMAAISSDLVIVPTGADVNSAVLRINAASLVAGTYNTLVALGTLGGEVKPSGLLLSVPTQAEAPDSSALVSLVHASAGSPAVDVYVNDVLIAPGLVYGVGTPHVALPAGTAAVAVRPARTTPDSAPLLAASLDLKPGTAATIAVTGPTASLTAKAVENNIAPLTPVTARIQVVNAASNGTATLSFANGDRVSSSQTSGKEVPAGSYTLAFDVDGAALPISLSLDLNGGVLYTFTLAGASPDERVITVTTGLNEQPGSAPSTAPAAPVAVASTPTTAPIAVQPTAAPTQAAVVSTPTSAPVFLPTALPATPTSPVPTLAPPPPPPTRGPTATPFGRSGITAQVDTDPGVNLKIREYPREDARTLALIPSGTTIRVDGVRGPAQQPGVPTPEATATLSAEGVRIEDLWVFVTWSQPDGGQITGWTRPQYLVITNERGRRVNDAKEILAFPQIPENEFGVIETALATPVGPDANFIIGTVTVDVGVNLQMRRTPGIDGESLALLPSGAQTIVIEKTEVPSLGGLVGEPQSTTWLFVRYRTDAGSIVGWVNSQFIALSQRGKPVELKDIPDATEIRRGGPEGGAVVAPPPPPAVPGLIATIDKLDPGVNLQLRRDPNQAAESLGLIPANSQVPVLGRNGSGLWLKVTFNGIEGWINSAFVTVTRSGRRIQLAEIENVTNEPDTAGQQPTPTPAS